MTPLRSMANGSRPDGPQVARTTILHVFGWGVQEDGATRNLILETPGGERIVLPFTPDKAQELGAMLMAPSVVRP